MPSKKLPEAAVFIATSLDGFIAREDGDLDWLHRQNADVGTDEGRVEDHGYYDFIANVDALVMGRRTYEKVLTFGTWPYSDMRVIVLSTGSPEVPEELRSHVAVLSLTPKELLRRLAASGVRRIYVDGGVTIQRFLADGLISELIITRIPVLIGSGIPLFGALPKGCGISTRRDKNVRRRTRAEPVSSGPRRLAQLCSGSKPFTNSTPALA